MTTTPGAVSGILAVGAKRHSTLQAMAPQCTTTPLMDVRIQPMHICMCLLSLIGQLLSWIYYNLAWFLLAPAFAENRRAVRLQMQMTEGQPAAGKVLH